MTSASQLIDPLAVRESAVLQQKIRGMRCRLLLVAMGSGLAAAVAAAMALLTVGMLLDWWLTLSRQTRAIMLAVDGAAIIWMIARHMIHPILSAPDDDMLALMVERTRPQFRGRLISSVQLTGAATPSSPSLIHALVADTERLAEDVDFGESIPTTTLLRLAIAATLMVLATVAGIACTRPASLALLGRAFLAAARAQQQAVTSTEISRSPSLFPDKDGGVGSQPVNAVGKSQKRAQLRSLLDRDLNDLSHIARDEETLQRDLEALIQQKAASTN
jgi:hypothetical protein